MDTKDISEKELIRLMVGREIDKEIKDVKPNTNPYVLEINNLTKTHVFNNVSFKLRKGEYYLRIWEYH